MFLEVQSSWFQVVFLHHTVAEDALPQSDLLLFFFILFFFELFYSLEAFLLAHDFVVLKLHVCWVILQLCSILLSFSKITSWTLLFNFFSSSKRSSNVSDVFPVFSSCFIKTIYGTHVRLFLKSAIFYWFFSLLLQNRSYFVLPFVTSIVLQSLNWLLTVTFFTAIKQLWFLCH